MDEEEQRAMREGLAEESLALFDLLVKPNLSKKDRDRIKLVAEGLLEILKTEKLRVDSWRDKEFTRSAVKTEIRNFLWDDKKGLPFGVYSEEEVKMKADLVFGHIYQQYRDASHYPYVVKFHHI